MAGQEKKLAEGGETTADAANGRQVLEDLLAKKRQAIQEDGQGDGGESKGRAWNDGSVIYPVGEGKGQAFAWVTIKPERKGARLLVAVDPSVITADRDITFRIDEEGAVLSLGSSTETPVDVPNASPGELALGGIAIGHTRVRVVEFFEPLNIGEDDAIAVGRSLANYVVGLDKTGFVPLPLQDSGLQSHTQQTPGA